MDRRLFLLSGTALGMSSLPTFADDDHQHSSSSTATTLGTPPVNPKACVIVIGGGMAGTTVAKYLRLWGDAIDVTLIERNPRYTSNIMSSLVLTGQRSLGSLSYGYDLLKSKYGVRVVLGDVLEVDPVTPRVRLSSGWLSADRIVLAPGIAFDPVEGLLDANLMPHAWQAGVQTTLLAQQLAALPNTGGVAVLTIPPTPYRCPPGPYERACLIGDWLKAKKPSAKLIVLDANASFVTEADNFSKAFALHNIDYRTGVSINAVNTARDAATGMMSLETNSGQVKAHVVNLIPRQRAGTLISATGLATATGGRFAPVNVLTYACTVPGADKVHVIGDASATTQPKAGHIANQEAKICADAISRMLVGLSPDPAPITNSACYSTITQTQASWLTAVFQYDPGSGTMVSVPAVAGSTKGASVGWSSKNFSQMNRWFNALMGDSFA